MTKRIVKSVTSQAEQLKALQEQIKALKEQGAGRFGVWESKETKKRYLSFKPKKGRNILLSKDQITEILTDAQLFVNAITELNID